MKIHIILKKDDDQQPRYADIEIDEMLVDVAAIGPVKFITQNIEPFIEAMLALDPADAA
jgi:hypothetical protein